MDAIEQAIRGALEKGDAGDRSFREKVYRQAFAALDRAIAANPNITDAAAEQRRDRLQDRVASIESEFIPAVGGAFREAESEIAVPPPPSRARPAAPGGRVEPVFGEAEPDDDASGISVGEPAREADRAEPSIDIATERREPRLDMADRYEVPSAEGGEIEADETRRGRPRGRLAKFFFAATILAALVIGAFFAYETGLIFGDGGGEVPNPPQVLEDESFEPEPPPVSDPGQPGGTDVVGDWITIFAPSDPTTVSAPNDASAEVLSEEGEDFIRIRSGPSGSAILFDVARGILEQIAGRRVVFSISARAVEGEQTQIAIDCNFGELGDCGRWRYNIVNELQEYLFDIEVPQGRPGADGTIAINTDIAGNGRAAEIFEIKVAPMQ